MAFRVVVVSAAVYVIDASGAHATSTLGPQLESSHFVRGKGFEPALLDLAQHAWTWDCHFLFAYLFPVDLDAVLASLHEV